MAELNKESYSQQELKDALAEQAEEIGKLHEQQRQKQAESFQEEQEKLQARHRREVTDAVIGSVRKVIDELRVHSRSMGDVIERAKSVKRLRRGSLIEAEKLLREAEDELLAAMVRKDELDERINALNMQAKQAEGV